MNTEWYDLNSLDTTLIGPYYSNSNIVHNICYDTVSYHSKVRRLGQSAGERHCGASVGQLRGVVRGQEGHVLDPEHPRVNLRELRPRPP